MKCGSLVVQEKHQRKSGYEKKQTLVTNKRNVPTLSILGDGK